MNELDKVLTSALIETPTVEKYRKIMNGQFWGVTEHAIWELKQYEAGLDGVAYLLNLTDYYKNELTKEEIKANRFRLWTFRLSLLDKLDRWEEFLQTIEELSLDPDGKEFLPKYPFILRSGGTAAAADNFVLSSEGSKAWKAAADQRAWYREASALRKKGEPSAQKWFVLHIVDRQRIIQKKIDRQKNGKSVKHLMHLKGGELSAEEYRNRIERIKSFLRRALEWEEWAQEMERKKKAK